MQRSPLLHHWLAHWFGCGLLPVAPGTFGSLGAIPVHVALCRVGPTAHGLAILTLAVVGVIVCQRAAKAAGSEDPNAVVIDEVVGTLVACWFVRGREWWAVALAFGLFRLFDITKPGLIDRSQHIGPPGVSIMLDDLIAGLVAGVLSFSIVFWV